jgi:chromosome partitioning protein
MGKIIAIAIPKGGVGKSTTAINLGASLAAADKRVLIVDLDPMGTCAFALGMGSAEMKGSVFDIFNFTKSVNDVIHTTKIANLDLIPSRIDEYVKEERLNRLAENKMLLRYVLRGLIFNYDFILIDCPPYLRGLTTCALIAADSAIVPILAETFSLNALKKMFEHIEWIKRQGNSLIFIEGILLNMFEPRTKISKIVLDELTKNHQTLLFKTVIPKNTTLTEATYSRIPALHYDASSKGSMAFLELAAELLDKSNHSQAPQIAFHD